MDDNSEDHYRRQAVDARYRAERARTDIDRAAWLRLAQGWLNLLTSPAGSPEDILRTH